jgi:hypothetical protein
MKHLKILGVALCAAFALAGVLTGSAFAALPDILPEPTAASPLNFEGKGGAGVIETLAFGVTFTCTGRTLDGSFTSGTSGTSHLHFTGCKGSAKESCQSAGDATGVILLLPAIDLVFDKLLSKDGVLGVAALLLKVEVHVTCTTIVGNVLLVVQGSVLGLIKPINVKTKTAELLFTQSKGDQTETTYYNDNEEQVQANLETSISGKAFESSGDASSETTIEKFSGKATEPEVMG